MTIHAAIVVGPGNLTLGQVFAPGPPTAGEVGLRPEAVGICGSDLHYFEGDTSALTGDSTWFPRILGHEISAIVDSLGAGTEASGLTVGDRVAVWPLRTCGECYACKNGRANACYNMSIVGIHGDGGLTERLNLPVDLLVPVGDLSPELAAFTQPMSVAVHALARGGVTPATASGMKLAILGGGPLGQALSLAANTWGALVAVVDPKADRQQTALALGAVLAPAGTGTEIVEQLRTWGDGAGPDVVFDATGVPAVFAMGLDIVARTGTVVIAGLSSGPATFVSGILPEKELTVVGSSSGLRSDLELAVTVVTARQAAVATLISHVIPLHNVVEAFHIAAASGPGTMKVVITLP